MTGIEVTTATGGGFLARAAHVPWQRSVRLVLRVDAGYADDPVSRPGLAHVCEHERIAHAADLVPGQSLSLNGLTEAGWTRFELSAPVDEWREAVQRVLAVLAPGGCSPERLAVERSAVLIEMERAGGVPAMRLAPLLSAHVATGTDLARLGEATRETVETVTPDDVAAFVDGHYVLGNAALTVTGPLPAHAVLDHVAAQAEKLRRGSGPVPPATLPGTVPPVPPVPELSGTLAATLVRPVAHSPAEVAAGDIALAAVTDADGLLEASSRRCGRRVAGASTLCGRTLELTVSSWGQCEDADLVAALHAERDRIGDHPDGPLAAARTRVVAAHAFAQLRPAGLADHLARWQAGARPPAVRTTDYETTPLDAVRAEAGRLLDSMRLWRIVAGRPHPVEVGS